MTSTPTILQTVSTPDPARAAQWFSTLLAVDRGWASTLVADGDAVLVVAADNRAVRFTRGSASKA